MKAVQTFATNPRIPLALLESEQYEEFSTKPKVIKYSEHPNFNWQVIRRAYKTLKSVIHRYYLVNPSGEETAMSQEKALETFRLLQQEFKKMSALSEKLTISTTNLDLRNKEVQNLSLRALKLSEENQHLADSLESVKLLLEQERSLKQSLIESISENRATLQQSNAFVERLQNVIADLKSFIVTNSALDGNEVLIDINSISEKRIRSASKELEEKVAENNALKATLEQTAQMIKYQDELIMELEQKAENHALQPRTIEARIN